MNTLHEIKGTLPDQAKIDFSESRWQSVMANAEKWWAGTLGRPLIQLDRACVPSRRPASSLSFQHFTAKYGLDVPADDVIVSWDAELSGREFLADSFPGIFMNFGPGTLAAFLGAELRCAEHTVWFHPEVVKPIEELSFEGIDITRNVWYQRIVSLIEAAHRRWGSTVQLSMNDLGGALDVLSSFLPGEQLLMELYDNPDEVKRLTWEIHNHWWKAFDDLAARMKPCNRGYTAWAQIFSTEPYYMFQCDFSYMIGPDMFDEFVKPELAASCRRLKHAFYHLDGVGQLPHLDSLLSIPELVGVQWVPGDGQPEITKWPEVYQKITRAGKKIQIFAGQSPTLGYRALDVIAEQTGTAENIVLLGGISAPDTALSQRDDLNAFLQKHGLSTTAS